MIRRERLIGQALFWVAALTASTAWGVDIYPADDAAAIMNANPASTTYVLKAGVHRFRSIQPKNGDTFVGETDASGALLTVLNGAAVLSQFSRSGSLWKVTGQTQQGQLNGECDATHPMCIHPEDLYFDNVPLMAVASQSAVVPGAWFFDYAAQTVYFADDPAGHVVELSTTRAAFYGGATDVTIQHLQVEKYAIPAQMGAVGDQYPGDRWTVEDNVVRLNHGTGIRLANGSQALRNTVWTNGFEGIGGTGQNILVNGNDVAYNNVAGFNCDWGCGGGKFAVTNGLIVSNNHYHDNLGVGVWTDIDNINTLYDGNLIENNWRGGISHEISYAAVIRNNIVRNNGNSGRGWLWDPQILLQNSQNVEVYGNTLTVRADQGNALTIISQNRGPGAYGEYDAINNYVHDNSVTFAVPGIGYMGMAGDFNMAATTDPTVNRFSRNHYHVANPGAFDWCVNTVVTFAQFQALGFDVDGTIDAGVTPPPVTMPPVTLPPTVNTVATQAAVRVYPNPWRADRHSGVNVTVEGLASGSTLSIFDIAGHLVKTQTVESGVAHWDRTNASGSEIASGIYLYLATALNGQTIHGKLAILR